MYTLTALSNAAITSVDRHLGPRHAPNMVGSATLDVRRYYDENTEAFIRRGHSRSLGAIRRAVWGPGAKTRDDAMRFVEAELETRIKTLMGGSPHILDLGCGICSTLCRLADRLPITGTGVTISPVQVDWAKRIIEEEGLGARLQCLAGDFSDLPSAVPRADLAFAIESFVHGPSPARFFQECARVIREDGLLVICDDFLSVGAKQNAASQLWLERFAHGWHINTLLTVNEASELARDAGFVPVETLDFSQFLELGRPRDKAIASLMWLAGNRRFKSTYWRMLQGGNALQACLKRGWLKYLFVVWKRVGAPEHR